jgi:putative transposase
LGGPEGIDRGVVGSRNPEEVFAQDGLLDELKKALAERILNAEMDQHLAAERAEEVIGEPRNHRNGHSRKTVLTGTGKLDLQVPRDRQASFEPQLIAKYRRRFPDFDDKVVSLYARGMTVRENQGHLRELYGVEVSPDLIGGQCGNYGSALTAHPGEPQGGQITVRARSPWPLSHGLPALTCSQRPMSRMVSPYSCPEMAAGHRNAEASMRRSTPGPTPRRRWHNSIIGSTPLSIHTRRSAIDRHASSALPRTKRGTSHSGFFILACTHGDCPVSLG